MADVASALKNAQISDFRDSLRPGRRRARLRPRPNLAELLNDVCLYAGTLVKVCRRGRYGSPPAVLRPPPAENPVPLGVRPAPGRLCYVGKALLGGLHVRANPALGTCDCPQFVLDSPLRTRRSATPLIRRDQAGASRSTCAASRQAIAVRVLRYSGSGESVAWFPLWAGSQNSMRKILTGTLCTTNPKDR